MIQRIEGEKAEQHTQKARNKEALEAAKKVGKDTYEAEKARIAQEKLAIAETKKQEKLPVAAAKQAEKQRQSAAKKAKNALEKVSQYGAFSCTYSFQRT